MSACNRWSVLRQEEFFQQTKLTWSPLENFVVWRQGCNLSFQPEFPRFYTRRCEINHRPYPSQTCGNASSHLLNVYTHAFKFLAFALTFDHFPLNEDKLISNGKIPRVFAFDKFTKFIPFIHSIVHLYASCVVTCNANYQQIFNFSWVSYPRIKLYSEPLDS